MMLFCVPYFLHHFKNKELVSFLEKQQFRKQQLVLLLMIYIDTN